MGGAEHEGTGGLGRVASGYLEIEGERSERKIVVAGAGVHREGRWTVMERWVG
jgi:hypothetical protein